MAYNIHWKIPFTSLRSGKVYTVNIYKDGTVPSGYPLTLKGGAEPFTTDEDASDDEFAPIRTQSGYLRIVDDGYAVNASSQQVAFNWSEILPMNDTDRPITLTTTSGGVTTIHWKGFIQAQNFGSTLYGNPQVREIPVQCPLSILGGIDVNANNTGLQNFGYLLKNVIDGIPTLCQPTTIVAQGGMDALNWLFKQIDWQNLIEESDDYALTAKYSLYQALEDMCRFWGWTARMKGETMYLTCADDGDEGAALEMTYTNLSNIAAGTSGGSAAGTVSTMYSSVSLSGDIFASINNEDSRLIGPDKITIKADSNKADEVVIAYAPQPVEDYLKQQTTTSETYGDVTVNYYGDLTHFPITGAPSPLLTGTAVTGRAAFTFVSASTVKGDAIRIKKSYSNDNVHAFLETTIDHSFFTSALSENVSFGGFQIQGNVYQKGQLYSNYYDDTIISAIFPSYRGAGKKNMYIRFGVGETRASAIWFNGRGWQSSVTKFKVSVGNEDNIFRITPSGNAYKKHISTAGLHLTGKVFVDILGSDDMPEVNGERAFFITDFAVVFSKHTDFENPAEFPKTYNSTCNYTARAQSNTGIENTIDLIYASENEMDFGYGVVMNSDGSPMTSANYNSTTQRPEQHLANRMAGYWNGAKRKIYAELRSNLVENVSPRSMVTIDGSTCHPISISRDWRDDVTRVTLLEM